MTISLLKGKYTRINFILIFLFVCSQLNAQITLFGDNSPHANVNDGDFSAVWDYWRNASQSPFWTTKVVMGKGPMGLHYGSLFSMNELGIAESKLLNTNMVYQSPKAGDIFNWSFGADLEYISNGTISISLIFGEHERILANNVKLIGSDKIVEHFNGSYTLTEEDAKNGLPYVRATFYSEQDVKVFLHYVNISVFDPEKVGPELNVSVNEKGIQLIWKDSKINENGMFFIYRKKGKKDKYKKIGETKEKSFLDNKLIKGIRYTYLVTRFNHTESRASNTQIISKNDTIPPVPPTKIETQIFDTEVKLNWTKSKDKDVANYSICRGDSECNNMKEIANGINKNWFEDVSPNKGIDNTYVIYSNYYSGNRSLASNVVKAKVKANFGSSFRDLILPMPIHEKKLLPIYGEPRVLCRVISSMERKILSGHIGVALL